MASVASDPATPRLAHEIGLTPKALAVAGFTSTEAGTVLLRLEGSEATTDYTAARSAVDSLAQQLAEAQEQWDAECTDEAADAVALAQAALATARVTAAERRGVLVGVCLDGASGTAISRVNAFRQWGGGMCPAAVRACAEASERSLLNALFSKASRDVPGELSTEESSTLSGWLSRSDVVQAQHDLDTNGAAIDEVFATWGQ